MRVRWRSGCDIRSLADAELVGSAWAERRGRELQARHDDEPVLDGLQRREAWPQGEVRLVLAKGGDPRRGVHPTGREDEDAALPRTTGQVS